MKDTPEQRRRAMAEDNRKALRIAADLIRGAARCLIRNEPATQPYTPPEFTDTVQQTAVALNLLQLADTLEPDRQHTAKTPKTTR